jgi:hypothetical protein
LAKSGITDGSLLINRGAESLENMGDMASIFPFTLVACLGLYIGQRVVLALRSGVANAAGTLYRRKNRPIRFWFVVSFQLLLVIVCATVLWKLLTG